ncbi:C39 family peptidase [Methanobrevibacter sp. V14]|uniref:C39 family peptidase n=1 Tax=Methanobrevibacter sp. V14 TaxID=3064280 RepID=UPI0027377C3D|nr:C39 family peptidase [Methanobrevibacter sp. V14]
MIKFSKNEMKKTAKILRKSIGKKLPDTIKMVDMANKTHKISKAQYMSLFESQNIFIMKNGRYPNYVSLNSTANNPLVMDYQDNGYTCGPTSLSMAIQMCFDYISEKKCAKACGTIIGSGTTPDKLINGAKSLGYNVTRIPRRFSAVKKSLQAGMPVIAHIQTRPATCLGYTGDYGHYILIYGYTKEGYYKIADPTKGIKKCSLSILDKATNGRDIGYYSVKPR